MAKQYNWRTTFNYHAGDPGSLSYGYEPTTWGSWQNADVGSSDSKTITYYYRDSNTAWQGVYQDILSSRVAVSVTQSWTTSVDSRNNLTVTVTTTINSVVRDDIRHPSGYSDQNTPGRDINIYREQGGQAYISTTDNQVATAHTISGSVSMGTYSFTLAPGQNLTRNTLFIHNQTVGSSSYDDIWAGVQFRNPLPADYRPGTSLDTNTSVWKSHNRTNGACHVRTNSGWQECRTVGGDSGGKGNPPLILTADNANSWRNQKLLGKE